VTAAPVEITSVKPGRSGSSGDLRWALDWPRLGDVVDARDLRVQGWILSPSGPALGVELISEQHTVARLPLNQPRADLERAFPDFPGAGEAGFKGEINVLAAHSKQELLLCAVLPDQRRLGLASFAIEPSSRAEGDSSEVSVVIPCFNQAHFLGDAIESVLAQTHPNIEVVVVDDGSRDNTGEVASRYPGVRCVHQENRGLAAARNTGLEQVKSEFVVFLDSDDRLLPEAIESGLRELRADPEAVMAAGAWRLIGEDGGDLPSKPLELPEDVYPALLESCFLSTPAAVIYRRQLFAEVGGFDPEVSASADYDLYLRAAARHPVRLHGEAVAEYRRHGANMTRDAELILRSEIAVLRRQSQVIGHRRDLRRARDRGITRSRAYHGERMVDEVRRKVDEGQRDEALRLTATLARLYPRGVPEALRALRRRGRR
jgi:glycosyltransferase involved in cell wall biosynthesis